jgi:EmrB/QacA subfamily drug resistance transporter
MAQANSAEGVEGFARWMIVATVGVGSIATILTATIINVAVPDIMGAFGIGQDRAQWVSTGYLAATTAAMLLTDYSIRRIGQRNTFILAIAVFIFGSIVGGMATNFTVLIFGRILQGAAAGITQPLAMLALFQIFPPNERGRAMGLYGMSVILAPAVGPYVGGAMVDLFSWRYVFFMPVPFSAIAILMAAVSLRPREKGAAPPAFDWIGFALASLFIAALLIGLTNGARDGWNANEVIATFVVAAAAIAAFIFWELRHAQPLLNLRLFGNPRFVSAVMVSFVFGGAIFASIYLVPLFLQIVQGYTPTRSGLLQLPAGLAMAVAFPLIGRLSDRGGQHLLTMAGLVVIAYSSFLMIGAHVDTPFWLFAGWMVLSRLGLSLVFPPLSAASLNVLPANMISQGSGVMNFSRSLGGAFGVNLIAISVDFKSTNFRAALADTQHSGNAATLEFMAYVRRFFENAGLPDTLQEPMALLYLDRTISLQADMLAFRGGFLLLAIATLAAVLPAWFMRPRKQPAVPDASAQAAS